MDNTSLYHSNNSLLEFDLPLRLLVPSIDIVNLLFLILGIYGMYNGIEIGHPLYMVLFINLIQATISTTANLCCFPLIAFDQYVKVWYFIYYLHVWQ